MPYNVSVITHYLDDFYIYFHNLGEIWATIRGCNLDEHMLYFLNTQDLDELMYDDYDFDYSYSNDYNLDEDSYYSQDLDEDYERDGQDYQDLAYRHYA